MKEQWSKVGKEEKLWFEWIRLFGLLKVTYHSITIYVRLIEFMEKSCENQFVESMEVTSSLM